MPVFINGVLPILFQAFKSKILSIPNLFGHPVEMSVVFDTVVILHSR